MAANAGETKVKLWEGICYPENMRDDWQDEKREKRERETGKSSGTAVKIPDVSRETFPIDDRLTNGHNEA